MGFFSGRLTCARYRVAGAAPRDFGPEHLDKLDANAIGKQRLVSADGVQAGWTAGDHILDTRFDLAKNIVNDALHFCLRVDSTRLPSGLLRAYAQVDLQSLAKPRPSGRPGPGQKRKARDSARERLEEEAKDG